MIICQLQLCKKKKKKEKRKKKAFSPFYQQFQEPLFDTVSVIVIVILQY